MFGGALKVRSTHRLFRFWMGLDGCECCKPHNAHSCVDSIPYLGAFVCGCPHSNNKTASATMAWKQGGATDPSHPYCLVLSGGALSIVEPFAHCSDQRLGIGPIQTCPRLQRSSPIHKVAFGWPSHQSLLDEMLIAACFCMPLLEPCVGKYPMCDTDTVWYLHIQ